MNRVAILRGASALHPVILLAETTVAGSVSHSNSPALFYAGCGACFIFAAIIAFLTTEMSRSLKAAFGKMLRGPAQLVVGGVPFFVASWNIKDVGAFHAVSWGTGILFGFCTSYLGAGINHFNAASQLTPKQWKTIRRYVFRSFFHRTLAEIEEGVEKLERQLQDNSDTIRADSMRLLHDFIHTARDEAIAYVSKFEQNLRQFVEHQDARQLEEFLNKEFYAYMQRTLVKLHDVFEASLGHPHNVWVAARMFSVLPSKAVYKTVARAGHFNAKRIDTSEVIGEDEGLPEFLRQHYKSGPGIVNLAPMRTKKQWRKMANDKFKEDKSILAGPIIIKSMPNPDQPVIRELFMILYVNSPSDNAFSTNQEDILRCCTDVLSLFFSLIRNKLDNAGLSELTVQSSRKVD